MGAWSSNTLDYSMSWSMEGIRSGLFRGGVRGRPRGSTPRLDGVEVDAAFEGLVVTGGPNFTSSEKPS